MIFGSLYKDVFERHTSTGSGPFALLASGFAQIFAQIVSITVTTLSNTYLVGHLVASRHIKRGKARLPVDKQAFLIFQWLINAISLVLGSIPLWIVTVFLSWIEGLWSSLTPHKPCWETNILSSMDWCIEANLNRVKLCRNKDGINKKFQWTHKTTKWKLFILGGERLLGYRFKFIG